MGDYAIRMQFDIGADPETVRRALTTTAGIASWWSNHVGGEPGRDGGRLEVSFPDVPVPFDFTVRLDGAIEWETGDQPEHWHGTTARWEVDDHPRQDGSTLLRFRHGGYDEANPIIDIVTPAWAMIISRLKGYAETGDAQPFFDF